MQDFSWLKDLLNVKFGYNKKGQPNMVSFNRLSKRYVNEEIDSYWILSIDGKDNHVCLFNLYEQLDYTNTNLGTGQVMLSETKFYPNFNQDKDYTIQNKDDILDKLDWIDEDAWERMTRAKRKKFNERKELRNDRNQTL